ncbi:cytochrome P450 [Aspergillus mulundensis]|uniref:Cytochrome P450 monooxygenase n=1 Tax=Aspergillus mulundensis TaxID=1810919 RepID=A0A3D8RLP5_9EURO|nr:Cytochrome P450 monooxygenase [Aspergillus mulundensis]RDW74721.1 Cytochrome P450 monooxygenase [Aspergillus mulundensis]
MDPYVAPFAGAVTGVCTHLLFYRHGEWDLKAPCILFIYIILGIIALVLDSILLTPHKWALNLIIWHIAAVYISMILYRALFHRLRTFPGPFLARLSNFYATYLNFRKLHMYEEVEKLHAQYGDYVRLGPTELSITDPEAVVALYGPQAQLSKGPWYHVLHPRVSLQTERDKKVHARRRKVWDMGFSSKALRNYEDRVSKYTAQLIDTVERAASTKMELDMSKWFNYYSFDVMGDMAFGKSFDMLVNGEDTYFLTALHGDMTSVGLFGRMQWLFPFFKSIPGLNSQYLKFWEFLHAQVGNRMQSEPAVPDVFSWILRDYREGPRTAQDTLNLQGDSYLIVVAGSDTTAAALAIIFFYLATTPKIAKQLQYELDRQDDLSHRSLGEIDFLEGIINEALRLHPAVPSGTQRVTPPDGMKIGDVYLPGDVLVQSPLYTIFRDPRNFESPLEFLPTRWTTEPYLVKNKAVYIPFNAGPYSCAGKQLALMELRSVTAALLKRYDITLAPGQSNEAFLEGLRDTFTLVSPPLPLIFSRRVRVEYVITQTGRARSDTGQRTANAQGVPSTSASNNRGIRSRRDSLPWQQRLHEDPKPTYRRQIQPLPHPRLIQCTPLLGLNHDLRPVSVEAPRGARSPLVLWVPQPGPREFGARKSWKRGGRRSFWARDSYAATPYPVHKYVRSFIETGLGSDDHCDSMCTGAANRELPQSLNHVLVPYRIEYEVGLAGSCQAAETVRAG